MRLSQWSGDIFIVDMRGKDARVLKSKSIKTKEIYWGVTHPSKGGPMGCVEWVGAVCERESGGGFQWKWRMWWGPLEVCVGCYAPGLFCIQPAFHVSVALPLPATNNQPSQIKGGHFFYSLMGFSLGFFSFWAFTKMGMYDWASKFIITNTTNRMNKIFKIIIKKKKTEAK